MISALPIEFPSQLIDEFCRTWKIRELSVFGSVLRTDFQPHSDIDFVATFDTDADWSLLDHSRMSEELSKLLGRKVDLVADRTLINPFRRREILSTRKVIYAA